MPNATILIIEDNAITRKMFRIALQSENYTVLEANDGQTALKQLQDNKPDLILQDLILPDMDGFELNHRLRASPNGASVPILALSGFLSKIEDTQGVGAEFTAFLTKPVEPSFLIEVIQTYLPFAHTTYKIGNKEQHILIADDNSIQLKLLRIQLMNAGFIVNTAVDGLDALEQIKKQPFDAVISDVLMPKMDGFELCLNIRNDPHLAHIPVILLTSHYLENADYELAKKVAANAYLTRTQDALQLIETLKMDLNLKTKVKLLNQLNDSKTST